MANGGRAGKTWLIYVRTRVVTAIIAGLVFLLLSMTLVASLVMRLPVPSTLFWTILIIGLWNGVAIEAGCIWALFTLGEWTGLDGRRLRRSERPGRFWTWACLHIGMLAAWTSAACFLTVTAIGLSPPLWG